METLVLLALLFAVGAGCFGWAVLSDRFTALERRKKAVKLVSPLVKRAFASEGLSHVVLAALVEEEQRIRRRHSGREHSKKTLSQKANAYVSLLRRSDLLGQVSVEACYSFRMRWAILFSSAGFLIGLVISAELAALMMFGGAMLGFGLVRWALGQEVQARLRKLDRELPEMLEVVALGLRSGLSFERSFQLYIQHFGGVLAKSCESAQGRWSTGLETREEALKKLAAAYDSPVLNRAMQSTIRSFRFGTSLAQTLEEAAREARALHKAARQESVAKAPVKMMVPTGALILPAMLILVLGPVLLELMTGL